MPTALDRYFKISERGSSLPREIRGGFATFFAMAYIIVLNPIILGSAKDMYGHQLDSGQLVTATVLTAAFSTLLMGVIGNVPIALGEPVVEGDLDHEEDEPEDRAAGDGGDDRPLQGLGCLVLGGPLRHAHSVGGAVCGRAAQSSTRGDSDLLLMCSY